MATYSKGVLSGSTHGRGVLVTATAIGSGTTIHTAVASATDIDLVTLFAMNSDSADVTLTLGFGGTTDPDDLIEVTLSPQAGLVLVLADLPLRNTLVLKAAASTGSVVTLFGYANQIRA